MTRFAAALTSASFTTSHLSDEAVAAFADGVLRDGARTRAEQHLSGCTECREAVRDQRAASAALRAAPLPCLPTGLADRLRNLATTTSMPPLPFTPAALTPDSQPLFAAFHTLQAAARAECEAPTVAFGSAAGAAATPTESGAVAAPGPFAAPAAASPHRDELHQRWAAGAGLGVMAVSAVAVTLLGSTAASAGGATPTRPAPAPAVSSSSPGALHTVGGVRAHFALVDSLNLTEPR